MNKIKVGAVIAILLMTSACAVGPLVVHETARTVGISKHELAGGYGMAGYALKWNYGLRENLDLGVQFESLSVGIRAKYAFINGQDGGWSLSTALGTGVSIGGSHQYIDLTASHLVEKFEPYFNARLVHVSAEPIKSESDTGSSFILVDARQYNYMQMSLGTRYWFNENWLLSVEGSQLFAGDPKIDLRKANLFGLGLGYRF